MKLTVKNVSPTSYYDGRAINYMVQTETISGQRLICLDPSGATSFLRPEDHVDGLLTALHYSLVSDKSGENCLTGIIRNTIPFDHNSPYQNLVENHFVGLETIDGTLFLYYNEKSGVNLPFYDGQIVNVQVTGGLYLELMLSDQFAV